MLDLGRTFEERNLEIANHNANTEQHLGRESGLAIAPAAEATNGVEYANITEYLRTLQMNTKATTATEGAGLKAGLQYMGPVDGSVRADGISSKNAMK